VNFGCQIDTGVGSTIEPNDNFDHFDPSNFPNDRHDDLFTRSLKFMYLNPIHKCWEMMPSVRAQEPISEQNGTKMNLGLK